MSSEHVEQARDIVIVGLSIRTSAQTAMTDIPPFWQRFTQHDLATHVKRRADDAAVYAVYCDYESDCGGTYSMVLGVAVDPTVPAPAGLRRVRVPRGTYARFVAEGDPSQVVWQTWMHINGRWDGRSRRRYIADYERYAAASTAVGHPRIDIMVGVE